MFKNNIFLLSGICGDYFGKKKKSAQHKSINRQSRLVEHLATEEPDISLRSWRTQLRMNVNVQRLLDFSISFANHFAISTS